MRRCTRCMLPETFPGIACDSAGVCNYCHSHQPVRVQGEARLAETLSGYRDRGREYDCIVPISGGRDSAYVLHQMVTKYRMRVLALTVDSGFILPEGVRNIEAVTRALGVPHVWLRDERAIETARKNARIKFRVWLRKPSIKTIVPVLNAGDKTMNLRMARYARDHDIPVVVGGNFVGNCSFEEEYWKRGFLGVYPDGRGTFKLRDTMKLVFLFGLEFLKNPYNFRLPILREYVTGGLVYFFEPLLRPGGVDFLGFYDYIYWNEDRVVSTVQKDLGWVGAADHTTTWRIDDSAYPLLNYLYYRLVGFTEHDEMYSRMIREGLITRERALQRCQADHQSQWIHGDRLLASLEELGVSRDELDDALEGYRRRLLPKLLAGRPTIARVARRGA